RSAACQALRLRVDAGASTPAGALRRRAAGGGEGNRWGVFGRNPRAVRARPRMSMLTAIIVDDEAPARALVKEFLAMQADVQLLAEWANGFEAVKAANLHKPDLLILDVQMPKLDGFEVLELLGKEARGVIFTTAHDEYALKAFNVH